jgi:hypothetical protein
MAERATESVELPDNQDPVSKAYELEPFLGSLGFGIRESVVE